jgi:hypothetical protein
MSDLSQHPIPATPAEGSREPKSAALLLLAILVRIPLIAGGILTGASVFLPWFHLSTTFGDGPHEIDVDPWTMLHLDAGIQLLVIAFAFLLAALGILVSSLLLALSSSAHKRSALMLVLLSLVFLYLSGALLAQDVASTGLALAWPYYHTTVLDGTGVLILGCLSAAFGAPLVFTLLWPRGRAESAKAA